MCEKIKVFNRKTKKIEIEKVLYPKILSFFYSKNIFSRFLLFFIKFPIFSKFYGFLQKQKFTRKKIPLFIKKFDIQDFEEKEYDCFYDFFIRKLSKKRSFTKDEKIVIMPADGRYLVFPNIQNIDGFYVKGKKFDLEKFLQNEKLCNKYKNGAMVICRLSISDYHRFHFPIDCFVKGFNLINGFLYSVHPMAIKKNIEIFTQNKRVLTELESKIFGNILIVEIGATNVGSIVQTYKKNSFYHKGEEKGFFALGGSSIVLFFEKEKIIFEKDLLENSNKKLETLSFMGDVLGRFIH